MSVGGIGAPQAAGREIKGPTALGGDFRRFVTLTYTLAVTDFKLRFYGSALGYVWQLVRPLLIFGVLYFVFTIALKFGEGVRLYPVVLLGGIMLFTFVAEAVSGAVTSLVEREPLVRKVDFPRLVVPLAVVLTACFNLALNLIVVLLFLYIAGGELTWKVIELPLILGALLAFVGGVSMTVSALYVRFRDLKPITEVMLQVMFYASPVLYPIEIVEDEKLRELLMLNPFAMIVQQFRHAVIDPTSDGAVTVAGGWSRIIIPIAVTVAFFVLGYIIFRRETPRIAEEL